MKTEKLAAFFACLLIMLSLVGCAVGRKLSYSEIRTDISTGAGLTYAIATHDQREEVVDGSQNESYVGYMRSTVGIAYPISTASGRNFSDDFSLVIKNSLNESKDTCQIIQTRASESKDQVLNRLITAQCDRLLLFTVTKWRTDSKPKGMQYGTDVLWDLTLEVFNKNAEPLASDRTNGVDPDLDLNAVGGSVKRTQVIVNEKFKQKIDLLLDDPGIQKTLRGE